MKHIREQFGNMDIYIFDQLLKGRFENCRTILDAGCGHGRNLAYFLQNDHDVYGVDNDPSAIASVQKLAAQLAPHLPVTNFKVADITDLPFPELHFDLVICNAVLHFAQDEQHFEHMLFSLWKVLRVGGFMFIRLASDIGIESLVTPVGKGRYLLPDGSERFLVDQEMILKYTKALNATLAEPIKTTNVQNLRCMTTWCLIK